MRVKKMSYKLPAVILVLMLALTPAALAFGPDGGGGGGDFGGGAPSGPSEPSAPSGPSEPSMPSGGSMPSMPSGGSMPSMPSGTFGGSDLFSMGALPGAGGMTGGAAGTGAPGMSGPAGFMPGTLVKIPEGIAPDQIATSFDAQKFGVSLPIGVTSTDFSKMLQGQMSFDPTTQDLIKGLNPGKFGPMSNPYGVSQAAGTFMDSSGKENFGDFLVKASTGQPDHDWIQQARELESQGKYKEAVAILSDPNAPFAQAIGSSPLMYKEILEAKIGGGTNIPGTGTKPKTPEGVIMQNLGAFLETATQGAPGGKYIIQARSFEKNGDYAQAAATLREQLKEHPDALVSAYAAELEAKVGNKDAALKGIENAIAMAPTNSALYEKAGEIYGLAGEAGPKVFVNGVKPDFDVKPQIQEGRTVVPFRALSETMGAQVDWNAETKTITMAKEGKTVEMTIGNNVAKVDGKDVNLDVAPQIIDGRTVVPLRFVGEGLDTNVEYDAATSIIKVMPKV